MSPYWHLQNQISAEIPALASKSTDCDVEIGIFQPTEIQLYLLLWKFGHRTNECVGFLIIIQVDLNLTPCSDYFKRDPTLLCHQLCTSACSVIICCWPDKAEMYPPRKEESYSVRAAISAVLLTAHVSGVDRELQGWRGKRFIWQPPMPEPTVPSQGAISRWPSRHQVPFFSMLFSCLWPKLL